MKTKVSSIKTRVLEPIKVEITLETQQEADLFLAMFNGDDHRVECIKISQLSSRAKYTGTQIERFFNDLISQKKWDKIQELSE